MKSITLSSKKVRSIRHDYPLEIEIREFSQEEFENLRNLSHHIREHFFFKYYQVMDEAIAHHLGGLEWHDDQWMIEAILCNLNRLLSEKGPEPTDDDLKDYIESHSLDLKWHPGAVEQMCIYSLHSFCDGCGDCADEDLQGADLG